MNLHSLARRHALVTYFGVAYSLSALAWLMIFGPKIISGGIVGATNPLLTFPLMVVGLGVAAIALTWIVDGRSGLRHLLSRMRRCRVAVRSYTAALLIPPVLILVVLLSLSALLGPTFAPKVIPIGLLFGVPAGFFEEIGWTGYAFPKMAARGNVLGASILLTQLLHASSTGFLVVLSPTGVTPAQETSWYAVYAVALWLVVAVVVATHGTSLVALGVTDVTEKPGWPSLPSLPPAP